jgi:hypothetical protein
LYTALAGVDYDIDMGVHTGDMKNILWGNTHTRGKGKGICGQQPTEAIAGPHLLEVKHNSMLEHYPALCAALVQIARTSAWWFVPYQWHRDAFLFNIPLY